MSASSSMTTLEWEQLLALAKAAADAAEPREREWMIAAIELDPSSVTVRPDEHDVLHLEVGGHRLVSARREELTTT